MAEKKYSDVVERLRARVVDAERRVVNALEKLRNTEVARDEAREALWDAEGIEDKARPNAAKKDGE